jgi:hypothetical protein
MELWGRYLLLLYLSNKATADLILGCMHPMPVMPLLLPSRTWGMGAMKWRIRGAHVYIHQLHYLPSQAQMSIRSRAKVDVQGTV